MGEQRVIFGGKSWHLNSILKYSKATSTDISAVLYVLSEAPAVQCIVPVTHTQTLPLAATLDIVKRDVAEVLCETGDKYVHVVVSGPSTRMYQCQRVLVGRGTNTKASPCGLR